MTEFYDSGVDFEPAVFDLGLGEEVFIEEGAFFEEGVRFHINFLVCDWAKVFIVFCWRFFSWHFSFWF